MYTSRLAQVVGRDEQLRVEQRRLFRQEAWACAWVCSLCNRF